MLKERMKKMNQKRLKEQLHYDPLTGKFTWLVNKSRTAKVGNIAGHASTDYRYERIGLDGEQYKSHVLAWFYMTGSIPNEEVDHIDGNVFNNAWSNLRLATREQNTQNAKIRKDNTIGIKGVHIRSDGRFIVRVQAFGKRHYIGAFEDIELAELVAIEAREKYHKQFARY